MSLYLSLMYSKNCTEYVLTMLLQFYLETLCTVLGLLTTKDVNVRIFDAHFLHLSHHSLLDNVFHVLCVE